MKVTIRLSDHRFISLVVSDECGVEDLKSVIENVSGIEKKSQILIYRGKILRGDQLLSNISIIPHLEIQIERKPEKLSENNRENSQNAAFNISHISLCNKMNNMDNTLVSPMKEKILDCRNNKCEILPKGLIKMHQYHTDIISFIETLENKYSIQTKIPEKALKPSEDPLPLLIFDQVSRTSGNVYSIETFPKDGWKKESGKMNT